MSTEPGDYFPVPFSKGKKSQAESSTTGTDSLPPPWPANMNENGTEAILSTIMESVVQKEDIATSSSKVDDVSTQTEEMEYTRASNVCVSSFVSTKLSSKANYNIWKAQMECLMRSQNMIALLNDEKYGSLSEWSRTKSQKIVDLYQSLLQGWLLGSIKEELLKGLIPLKSPSKIWKRLRILYDPQIASQSESRIRTPITVTEGNGSDDIDIRLKKKLRDATLEGHWGKIKSILTKHKNAATVAISDNGDTLLHLAVREGSNYFIEKLLSSIGNVNHIETKNSDHHTCLHVAAIVGNKDAAELLVNKRNALLGIRDNESKIPLHSAYLNNQINTFLYLWEATATAHIRLENIQETKEQFGEDLLHTAIYTKQYALAEKLFEINPDLASRTHHSFVVLTENFPSDIGFGEALFYPSFNNGCQKIVKRSSLLLHSLSYLYTRALDTLWTMRRFKNNHYSRLWPEIVIILLVPIAVLYPVYQLIRLLILALLFPCFMLYFLLWKVLAFVVEPVKCIEQTKNDYEKAKEFLKLICDKTAFIYYKSLKYAVRLDIYEVVHHILQNSSEAINAMSNEGHTIIQLTVINRSENVYKLIKPIIEDTKSQREKKDSFENNLLHLAGRLAPSHVLDHTSGAGLQLQREIQWRKEVEKLMGPTQLTDINHDYETPEMVFRREHADLVKEGEKWMKNTAESCSISTALIVTIVFAAAITVPGGSNQDTGIPLFKKDFAFTVFAVSDAISLFTGVASLLVFLSILTARFSEKDFLISLPRRLLIGLCLSLLSTTAMILAFCAILFLVFCDQRPWMLAPIGGLACVPTAAIVTLQLPLVVDLYQSTYSHTFGKDKLH